MEPCPGELQHPCFAADTELTAPHAALWPHLPSNCVSRSGRGKGLVLDAAGEAVKQRKGSAGNGEQSRAVSGDKRDRGGSSKV